MGLFGVPIEVLQSLLTHYQNAGLDAQLLPKESKETVEGKPCIMVKGKHFNLVQVTFARGTIGSSRGGFFGPVIKQEKRTSYPVLNFNYIIKDVGRKNEKDLVAKLKAKKEGLIKKKLLDVYWEGGALARKLNLDGRLKDRILKAGTDNLEVKPEIKHDFIKITHQKKIALIAETKGVILGKTKMRAEELPPVETLNIIDEIVSHVKSL